MSAAPEGGPSSGAAEAFPWEAAMAVGLGQLRLPPDTFWRMTPREFAHAVAPMLRDVSAAPSRDAFQALASRFPDHERRQE